MNKISIELTVTPVSRTRRALATVKSHLHTAVVSG